MKKLREALVNGNNFQYSGDYFQILDVEKERSQRNNRFFIVMGISIKSLYEKYVLNIVEKCLRSSDYIFYYDRDKKVKDEFDVKFGILLPETDEPGASIVKDRLVEMFQFHRVPLQMGLAIYPDDATASEKLLEKAFG